LTICINVDPPEMYKGFQQQINYNVYGKRDLDDVGGEKNDEMEYESESE